MSYKPDAPEIYQGKQVIINSDRLLFNAKDDSILLFSKEAIGFSTVGSIHFDTSDKKDGDKASKVVINSPNIYLGLKREYGEDLLPTESAVLALSKPSIAETATATDTGIGSMQDYVDPAYLSEDYVGQGWTFT